MAGDRRARVVARANFSCGGVSCDFADPEPLLGGAGRLLAYSYVTLGQVKRIVAGHVRALFATSGDVRGIAVGGGRVAALSLTLGGGPGRLDAPAWSPDGTKLAVAHGAFVVFDTAAFPVAVMNADGTGLRDLPSSDTCLVGSYSGAGFAWSPDGQKIAYDDCWRKIRVVNADGSGDRVLTEGTGPAWSPDGTTIAFERDSLENTTPAIYVMDPDGSNIRELVSLGTGSQHHVGPLAWSPDGTRIAFSLDGVLEVVNADGSDPHELGTANGDEPTWSPDSSEIAFRRTDGLFVIGANGTDPRRLTKGPDAHPSWSPDGKTIVFARQALTTIDGQQLKDLYAVDPDGSNVRPFAVPPVRVESRAKVRSSNVRRTFAAEGTPAGLALAGKLAAVGSVAAGIDRITLFKATTGARISMVEVGADHGDFSVVGADAHWIVFHVGRKMSALKIDSRKAVRLANPRVQLMDISVSGRRVAWLERFRDGHTRIRALDLPS